MTPQERQLASELFDRLSRLEATPREADAERAIADGLARAPNAVYALVQTVLVQDEALKRADARIRALSGADDATETGGGFLDSMRSTLTGRSATSVPSVRAANEPDPRWNGGGGPNTAAPQFAQHAGQQAAPPAPVQSGSFLGTAAASAAGVIGGALLFQSIGSLMGSRSGSAHADVPPANAAASPWDNNAAGSDLARDAGVNDISGATPDDSRRADLFDTRYDDADPPDGGSDFGGEFGGDV